MSAAGGGAAKVPDPQLFITNALGNPFVEEETLGRVYEPIAKSRRDANRIKKMLPITVVIGNPPYKNQAGGKGSWIESGSSGRATPMDWWLPPASWKSGAHTHHLKNLYIYFWRWASLKVFGSGWHAATGLPESDREGIVCFITVAGFLNGPGFQRMRDDLRRSSSEIWVVDCSPDGHQPEVATRIFEGVQQPVCIVLAARRLENRGISSADQVLRSAAGAKRAQVRGTANADVGRVTVDRRRVRLARSFSTGIEDRVGKLPRPRRSLRLVKPGRQDTSHLGQPQTAKV